MHPQPFSTVPPLLSGLWYARNFIQLFIDRAVRFCDLADFFWSGLMPLSFLPTFEFNLLNEFLKKLVYSF